MVSRHCGSRSPSRALVQHLAQHFPAEEPNVELADSLRRIVAIRSLVFAGFQARLTIGRAPSADDEVIAHLAAQGQSVLRPRLSISVFMVKYGTNQIMACDFRYE